QDQVASFAGTDLRRGVYERLLTKIRLVVITRMAKPEEVLIVEDENAGEVVRETTKDTEAIAQYKSMRETLVYLTHLNNDDTEQIMLEKLSKQVEVSGSQFTWNSLNTLCWAIGSISGAMNEEEEKRFLVTVIKDLLNLVEMKRGKDNKAVVASNIMYVVGQYPRFLRAHWKFLRTVVNKLFEFMHELHPGVQDMACDTFLKISQKCKGKFMATQLGESIPFVEELLRQLHATVSDLETHQITKILKTNTRVCGALGPLYIHQLSTIFMDVLKIYQYYSENISQAVAEQGELATRLSHIRAMRGAKKEVLRLLTTFIEKAGPPQAPTDQIAANFLPPMLDPILGDYHRNIAGARDPEVLSLFSQAIEKLGDAVQQYVPRIMEAVFECTLLMITRNFEDFPEHRLKFFRFLKAVNTHCFGTLFEIPPEHQKLVVDSVVWAFKHTERNIAETGLEILYELLMNVGRTPAVAQGFYRQFLLSLIQSNRQYVMDFVGNLLLTSFPNLTKAQVAVFVAGLLNSDMDLNTFKLHLRDFLVTLK
ncbi:unnamed protein product, partial [Ectocarpus sp. 4 AP-2014]